jgi:KipI family sensor histidine kinase inhibitor
MAIRLLAAGDAGVLVEFDDPAQVLPFAEALRQAPAAVRAAVTDIVPAERTVLVRFAGHSARAATVIDWLRSMPVGSATASAGPLIELDVVYDGVDLPEVARLTGLSPAEVIAAHTEPEWVVAFSGFAPGFGYLRRMPGGPDPLLVPRRDEPRVRVPAGAVALAAGYSGVYPRASPGGWQLIGRTDAHLWDADRDPPALLPPGARVRFRAVPG